MNSTGKNIFVTGVIFLVLINCKCFGNTQESSEVASSEERDRPVTLAIPQGNIKGLLKKTQHNEIYQSFEGIPYAEPPIGELRFKDPIPAERWNSTLDGTKPGSQCVQRHGDEIVGSENCLFLNVYIPLKNQTDDSYPVMVYIHGGGFLEGSASLLSKPDLFIDQKVALVTINYRLGPLGFLSMGTEEVPGNAGMKDQVEALRWVQKNIAVLGGNPRCVTIFGESAGGASVLLHQISGMSRGLFHRVISISGSSLCDWAFNDEPAELQVYSELVKILKLDHDKALNELQKLPAANIIKAGEQVNGMASGDFGNYPFIPTVEMVFNTKDAFLNMTPSAYYDNSYFAQVPTMMGYVSKEFADSYNTSELPDVISNPVFLLPRKWLVNSDNETLEAAMVKVKEFYFGAGGLDINDREQLISAVDLSSDLGFLKPVTEVAEIIANKSKKAVYLYRFSYRGGMNDPSLELFGLQGAAHGDELGYIFPNEKVRVNETSSDGWVRRRLMKLYTNFAKTGNPNQKPEDHLLHTRWIPVTSRPLSYMELSGEMTMSRNPDAKRARFWRNLERFVLKGPKFDGKRVDTHETK